MELTGFNWHLLTWVAAGLAVILLLAFAIRVFNRLTKKRILVQEGFSGIGALLQRRNDLIPNLVETVKGYAGHENKTLAEVIKWRNQSAAAVGVAQQNEATLGLDRALLNFSALTESYPELKANENFLDLQRQLSETEDQIAYARRYYNGTVRDYNQAAAVFPANIIAGIFGFKPEAFFAEDPQARTAPQVRFN